MLRAKYKHFSTLRGILLQGYFLQFFKNLFQDGTSVCPHDRRCAVGKTLRKVAVGVIALCHYNVAGVVLALYNGRIKGEAGLGRNIF